MNFVNVTKFIIEEQNVFKEEMQNPASPLCQCPFKKNVNGLVDYKILLLMILIYIWAIYITEGAELFIKKQFSVFDILFESDLEI